MADYVLTCCSAADLSAGYFRNRDIGFICMRYQLDGVEKKDDLWSSVSPADFYQAMLDGADTHTTQVNYIEYIAFWKPYLESGKDIIHVTLSSGLSGTFNSARIAAEEVLKDYPGRKIAVIDSLCASTGYGLLMDTLADLRDEGIPMDGLVARAEGMRMNLHHWFFSSDLTFYIRGGRVSKAAGFIGKLLNICLLLNVDRAGRLIPRDKIRSKRKAIKEVVSIMSEHARDGLNYSGKVFINHSDCEEDARALANLIESTFPRLNGKVQIFPVGIIVGSHTGPGTVSCFFFGDERED